MIGRRALLGAGIVLAATGADCVPPDGRLVFRVARNDRDIGSHVLDFSVSGDIVETRIDVRLAVKFGPITLFRYHHSGIERSQGGAFVSLETQTDNDGEALTVSARRDGGAVVVAATGLARQTFAADARPLTHWNRACMVAPLFNPQNGKPLRYTVTPRGRDATLDEWYSDDAGVWTKLRAVAEDGSIIDYRRVVA
jgi:hypothetical protein